MCPEDNSSVLPTRGSVGAVAPVGFFGVSGRHGGLRQVEGHHGGADEHDGAVGGFGLDSDAGRDGHPVAFRRKEWAVDDGEGALVELGNLVLR